MSPTGTLVFDIETGDANRLFTTPPEEFVRLIGYKWAGRSEVVITTDLEELKAQIRSARWIIGHNIHAFDLPAVFGHRSNEPMELADAGRVFDTWTHAPLVNPAPFQYVNRNGKKALADSPEKMKAWYSLDEQAYQLGVTGKTHDLKALAKEFGGFDQIPVDDERFVEYLRGDVLASEAVARALNELGSISHPYALRKQRVASRMAVISSNGLRVDIERAEAREAELAEKRGKILAMLQEKYDFPTEGKSPWATTAGKEAIFRVLADYGVTPESKPDWPRTATGNFSLGGDALVKLTKDTGAEELGKALAELKGQRSLARLALDSVHSDGFVHPDIYQLQRSGRWSTTKPGLTVWTSRGDGAAEKEYFIADSEDEVLFEIDFSNADARVVAALSGDKRYAERFEPGADGHMINAYAAWGKEVVDSDPKKYRQMAKPLGHGWSYGGQAKGLSRASGLPLETSQVFVDGMNAQFSVLVQWQNRVRDFARKNGCVVNEWGGKLWVEKGREFTQAPALLGQNGTTEIVCDALLRMPYHVIRRVKAQIHDAILFSIPKGKEEAVQKFLFDIMEGEFKPAIGGQRIEFPVDAQPAGYTWREANHA